jgi:dipeptidyl aminopeptidase/acylaminoacyl peptidase
VDKTSIASPTETDSATTAPFGSWISPITADLIVNESRFIGTHGFDAEVRIDGSDIYWLEGRPLEKGRAVLVQRNGESKADDVTPRHFDVRTQVYGYGGGAWLVLDGTVYFTNRTDGRLYCQKSGMPPKPLTPKPPTDKPEPIYKYADGMIDPGRNRWIGLIEDWSAVLTVGREQRKSQPEHRIVSIDLSSDGSAPGASLAAGHDFYASPRISPNGELLTWLAWDHPHMPWHATSLYLSDLDSDGSPLEEVLIAGGDQESIMQPEWSPDGSELWFISDRSGWWNLYCYDLRTKAVRSVAPVEAEFGQPQWRLSQSTYAFLPDGRIIAACTQCGRDRLVLVEPKTGSMSEIDLDYTRIESVQADGLGRIVFIGGAPAKSMSVALYELPQGAHHVLTKETEFDDNPAINRFFTSAEWIEFATTEGELAHAIYYPPANPEFKGGTDEKPPLVVMCHGGPTSRAFSPLNLEIQYRTSRGIAVLDVNYRGSSGFGRAYRDRLEECWGIIDVADCINGARYLADKRLVDPQRMVITGRSSGGFTTLAALTSSTFHDYFRAGASHYGIGDLEELAKDTHKFESRYLEWLVGPCPEDLRDRSPKTHKDHLTRPVIFFQGDKDKIVPPSQSEMMFQVLKSKGLSTGYLLFAGEGHGFRRADNVRRAIEAEHYFFAFQAFQSRLGFGEVD